MNSLPLFLSRTGTHISGALYLGLSKLQRVCLTIKLLPCAVSSAHGYPRKTKSTDHTTQRVFAVPALLCLSLA